MPLLPFTRVLVSSDILANAITLIIFALGVLRLQTNLPLDESRNVYLGPKHAATHVCSVFLAYVVTSIGPLVLLRFNPHLYFKHRVPIVVAVRLMRLVVLQLTLNSHPMAAPIARISVARALESPSKGLIILVTQPMAFFMHHSMYLLPWRIAVLFQLATTAVLLRWYAWFPCFVGQALGSSTSHPWQNTASQACGSLQSYAALARAGLGAPLTEFSATLCDGPSALAVLQTFWTLVCLFVVPIALTHELERWMKLRYQQYLEDAGSSAASGGSGSSSSSRRAAAARVTGTAVTQRGCGCWRRGVGALRGGCTTSERSHACVENGLGQSGWCHAPVCHFASSSVVAALRDTGEQHVRVFVQSCVGARLE
jgi:hypothetical protein